MQSTASTTRRQLVLGALGAAALPAFGQKNQAPGVTATEIKIGQTFAYSGPAGAYSSIAKSDQAYFKMVNEKGGIKGRKLNLISLDDGYSPPKALELTRRLVEVDEVAFIFGSLGTAINKATQKYLNQKKVPQILISSQDPSFGDPQNYPWTMGWQSTSELEGVIFGKYILQTKPAAKIGVLYQNDDFGKNYLRGVRNGLGARANAMIVSAASYETTDATIDSQITSLRSAGADTFINIAIPKFCAQAIRLADESGWKPLQFLVSASNSVGLTLKPAGLERSVGLISAAFYKDPTDPQWANDAGMAAWRAWAKQYYPEADLTDANIVLGYSRAATMVQILTQCGDDLSRENIMKQAANLKNLELPLLLPGVKANTSPTNFNAIRQMQMCRFDGTRWVLFGDVISG